jgi:hypothetical protein
MHSDIGRNRSQVCSAIEVGAVVDVYGSKYWQAQLDLLDQ